METTAPRGASSAAAVEVFLVLIIVILSVFAGYSLLNPAAGMQNQKQVCDEAYVTALQLQASGLCVQNFSTSLSPSNSSELVVPVLLTNPGSNASLEIMYLLDSQFVGAPVPHRNVTSSEEPVVISVPTGQVTRSVVFSNASLLFVNKYVMIYSYMMTVLANASGYYAILPPYYYGMYPALAVGASPYDLNMSALGMWGYSGVFQSSEVTIPSDIVGIGGAAVVNSTVPLVPQCPNVACTIISRSGT